jgi:hypothetical protein
MIWRTIIGKSLKWDDRIHPPAGSDGRHSLDPRSHCHGPSHPVPSCDLDGLTCGGIAVLLAPLDGRQPRQQSEASGLVLCLSGLEGECCSLLGKGVSLRWIAAPDLERSEVGERVRQATEEPPGSGDGRRSD